MNFNTLEFLALFLPITLGAFYLVPMSLRLVVLCVASTVFYGVVGVVPLAAMIVSILWGAGTAFLIALWRRGSTLWLAIFLPLFFLFTFKYLNFTLNTFDADHETRTHFIFFLSVVLPPGISFYTFQIIAYLIDVYDGKVEPERNILKLYAFISMFSQLIAGPILRYEQMRDQLTHIATVKDIRPDWAYGLKFISIGLFGKIFFSDVTGSLLGNYTPDRNGPWLDAAFNTLGYSFQIYYDFWAYSLMAIGLARLFSLKLPMNFAEPYLALSPREFWRRWHITLSYWLRDYAYIKMGGNRSYVRNIVIVFLLCGLWHGAGWNFVIWGAYHAVLVLSYHFIRDPWDRLPRPLQIALTFTLVTLGWPLFQFGFEGYVELMLQLFSFGGTGAIFGLKHWMFLAVIAAWTFLARERDWLYNELPRRVIDLPYLHAGLATLAILFFSFRTTFIYFRF